MRDKTHNKQVERWARHVRENPNWKKELKKFLDAQLIMTRRAYADLENSEEGKKNNSFKEIKQLDIPI